MSTSAQDGVAQFDASLPAPYRENWREAYRTNSGDSPRTASYQAPGGEAIPFVQKSFRFSGGQSRDTAEYPFGGLWSNEYINEKPQTLTVEGYLRGPAYIARRNKLIEALRVPTDDDNPGYIDLPFWGRFPVVVGDNYEVSENTDEQGQCAVSIPFTRAGVSAAGRQDDAPSSETQVEEAAANSEAAAVADFEARLSGDRADSLTLTAAYAGIKNFFLGVIGRIQGARTILNSITGEVLGILNFIDWGMCAPREFAQALFNAGAAVFGGLMQIQNSANAYYDLENNTASSSSKPSPPPADNEKNILICFLSADTFSLFDSSDSSGGGSDDGSGGSDGGSGGSDGGSDGSGDSGGSDGGSDGSGDSGVPGSREATEAAVENLYRIMAFSVSAQILVNMDSLTYKKAEGYWRLVTKLEESIDRENPAVYTAIQDTRTALSEELSRRELSAEMTRSFYTTTPLLFMAYYLGCDEDKIRELNGIADSFVIEGDVIYV